MVWSGCGFLEFNTAVLWRPQYLLIYNLFAANSIDCWPAGWKDSNFCLCRFNYLHATTPSIFMDVRNLQCSLLLSSPFTRDCILHCKFFPLLQSLLHVLHVELCSIFPLQQALLNFQSFVGECIDFVNCIIGLCDAVQTFSHTLANMGCCCCVSHQHVCCIPMKTY
jgi:hypothetical protein